MGVGGALGVLGSGFWVTGSWGSVSDVFDEKAGHVMSWSGDGDVEGASGRLEVLYFLTFFLNTGGFFLLLFFASVVLLRA